jgi:hypothetical protein
MAQTRPCSWTVVRPGAWASSLFFGCTSSFCMPFIAKGRDSNPIASVNSPDAQICTAPIFLHALASSNVGMLFSQSSLAVAHDFRRGFCNLLNLSAMALAMPVSAVWQATRRAFLMALAFERPCETIAEPLTPNKGTPPYSA